MIDGSYAISFDSMLLGHVEGKVTVSTEGNVAHIDLDVDALGKQKVDGTCEGDNFSGEGELSLPLIGDVEYTLQGKVSGDDVNVTIRTSRGSTIELTGERI